MSSIVKVDEGLFVERVCASQANVFMDDRIYYIHRDEVRDLAEEIRSRTNGAVTVYLSGLARGIIVLVWNPALAVNDDDLPGATAYLSRCIAETHIARRY